MPPVTSDALVLEAAARVRARAGTAGLSLDAVAAEVGLSRATVYRMYPGGREVLLEALRVHQLTEFFAQLRAAVDGLTDLEETLVRAVVTASRALAADENLALLLAGEPGEALSQLTVDGVPRILRMATAFGAPLLEPLIDRHSARVLVETLARLVISLFLAPSEYLDLSSEDAARRIIRPVLGLLVPATR